MFIKYVLPRPIMRVSAENDPVPIGAVKEDVRAVIVVAAFVRISNKMLRRCKNVNAIAAARLSIPLVVIRAETSRVKG